jgi:hypothetical protein
VQNTYLRYAPISSWDDLDYYIEMWVEKIDLKSLFLPVCKTYKISIANCRGWSDLNIGPRVFLYCGDHNSAGLQISSSIRSNLAELAGAVGWRPNDLIVDRSSLNADFIFENDLTWIDNLKTGTGDWQR